MHEQTGSAPSYYAQPTRWERVMGTVALAFMVASMAVGSVEILRWAYSLARGFRLCQN